MFGLGSAEILLVAVVVLLVLGPRRLPEIGGAIGGALRAFRGAAGGQDENVPRELPPPRAQLPGGPEESG
jgi:sec-independent protein translocase protein TatA